MEADASDAAIKLEAGPFWANALIMVELSLPLPAEVIARAFEIFLLPDFFVEFGPVVFVSSEARWQRADVTPELL